MLRALPCGCDPWDDPSEPRNKSGDKIMLNWALVFLVVALIAAVFGFGGIAIEAAWIAKVLFVVFLVLFLVSLLTGAVRRPPA